MENLVYVVDDDKEVRKTLVDLFNYCGNNRGLNLVVIGYANGEELLSDFSKRTNPDLVLTDFNMSGMNGADLARRIKEINKTIPVYVASGIPENRDPAIHAGAKGFFVKPLKRKRLESMIDCILEAQF